MKKFVCSVCGYVYEGETAPEFCPQCKAPASKFVEQKETELNYATEHVVGVAQGCPADIMEGLQQNFTGECTGKAIPKSAPLSPSTLLKKRNTLPSSLK